MAEPNRKLAAIMSADVVGYSRLMAHDEAATVATLQEYRAAINRVIVRHKGRVVNAPGDNILAEFPSAVEAVHAAVEIQKSVEGRNVELPDDRRMPFRVGVNLGDVIEEADGTIYGDGVNIAARMEALAEPGGICISSAVYDAVQGKIAFGFEFLGEQQVKNIDRPITVYRVRSEPGTPSAAPATPAATVSRRSVLIATAAVVILVVAGLAVWQATRAPAPSPHQVADVTAEPENPRTEMTSEDPVLALPTGPSIAVLPFENLSENSSDDYFAAGLAGDISVQLSYVQALRIIGRSSTQKYQGTTTDARHIAAELGVQYVLVGSVRRSTKTIRVTAELLHGGDGSQLWAETYDRELTTGDVFTAQDAITRHVVSTISDEWGILPQTLLQAAANRGDVSLSSYECVLLAYEFIITQTQELHARARDCLEDTVKRDPDYADAWGSLAHVYALEAVQGFNTRPNSFERSLEAALKGVRANDKSQIAWGGLAAAYYYNHQLDKFSAAADRAVAINPNDVSTLGLIGYYYGTWGLYDNAIPLLDKALALSPFDVWWYWVPYWMQAFENADYALALKYAHNYEYPGWFWTYVYFTSTYAHLNQTENARKSLKQLLELKPKIATTIRADCRFWNFPEPVIATIVDGFRKAGLDIPDEPAASTN